MATDPIDDARRFRDMSMRTRRNGNLSVARLFADGTFVFFSPHPNEHAVANCVQNHGPEVPLSQWSEQDRKRGADPKASPGAKMVMGNYGEVAMLYPHP